MKKLLFPLLILVTLKKAVPNVPKGITAEIEIDPNDYSLENLVEATKTDLKDTVLHYERNNILEFCDEDGDGGYYQIEFTEAKEATDFFKIEVLNYETFYLVDGNVISYDEDGISVGCADISLEMLEEMVADAKKRIAKIKKGK